MVLAMLVMASCRVGGIFVEPHTRDMDGTSFLKTDAQGVPPIPVGPVIWTPGLIGIAEAELIGGLELVELKIIELEARILQLIEQANKLKAQLEDIKKKFPKIEKFIKEQEEFDEEIEDQKLWNPKWGVGPEIPIPGKIPAGLIPTKWWIRIAEIVWQLAELWPEEIQLNQRKQQLQEQAKQLQDAIKELEELEELQGDIQEQAKQLGAAERQGDEKQI